MIHVQSKFRYNLNEARYRNYILCNSMNRKLYKDKTIMDTTQICGRQRPGDGGEDQLQKDRNKSFAVMKVFRSLIVTVVQD